MCYANHEKQKTTNEGIDLPNQEKNQNIRRKGNLLVVGNIGSKHNQTSGQERTKIIKDYLINEKTTQNQTMRPKSHQTGKNLGCYLGKILGAIFEVDERRTLTNEP